MYRLCGCLLSALLVAGCGGPGDHDHPQLTKGEDLYTHHCAECHQGDGDGDFLLGVPPVRYNAMSYSEMVAYIQGHTRPGDSRMPLFPNLSQPEAEKIAVYVRQRLGLR